MKAILILTAGMGMTIFILGVAAFVYGSWVLEGTQSFRLGSWRGSWSPMQYAFGGAILAALGSGLLTVGILGLRTRRRREA